MTAPALPAPGSSDLHALFVSDLHLAPQRPHMRAAFVRLLRTEARGAQALYILGDLFDYWIGDDDLEEPQHAELAAELKALADAGCALYFIAGNRDFLLGKRFAAASGIAVLPDPARIELGGVPTLLLHGDTLCLDDVDYQAFRRKVHDIAWQRHFLAQPRAQRRETALKLRSESESSQQLKTDAIMDVSARAVEEAFRAHGCTRMIHGHTHRPARHEHRVDGRLCERWVLADWYRRASYLSCDAGGCKSVDWA
jgi:UDP-2,3-diacylglucosamine hydrolase